VGAHTNVVWFCTPHTWKTKDIFFSFSETTDYIADQQATSDKVGMTFRVTIVILNFFFGSL